MLVCPCVCACLHWQGRTKCCHSMATCTLTGTVDVWLHVQRKGWGEGGRRRWGLSLHHFVVDEREQAGEERGGGRGGKREARGKRERSKLSPPLSSSPERSACFVICDITAINSTSTEADTSFF